MGQYVGVIVFGLSVSGVLLLSNSLWSLNDSDSSESSRMALGVCGILAGAACVVAAFIIAMTSAFPQ